MSKGYGSIQRRVLEVLERHQRRAHADDDTYVTVLDLAAALTPWDQEVDASKIESVRRAVKKLAAEGVIELKTIPVARDWITSSRPTTKQMLAARLETKK
jgi:hypothetical protein